jgi:hypothetical protein
MPGPGSRRSRGDTRTAQELIDCWLKPDEPSTVGVDGKRVTTERDSEN